MNTANRVLDELYFITTTVVDWVDIFTRPKYKNIILESLAYCQQQKVLKIYAWVLMSNHLHMIVSAGAEQSVADIIRDFKNFTSKRILADWRKTLRKAAVSGCSTASALPVPTIRR